MMMGKGRVPVIIGDRSTMCETLIDILAEARYEVEAAPKNRQAGTSQSAVGRAPSWPSHWTSLWYCI